MPCLLKPCCLLCHPKDPAILKILQRGLVYHHHLKIRYLWRFLLLLRFFFSARIRQFSPHSRSISLPEFPYFLRIFVQNPALKKLRISPQFLRIISCCLWRLLLNFYRKTKVFQRPCRSVLLPSSCYRRSELLCDRSIFSMAGSLGHRCLHVLLDPDEFGHYPKGPVFGRPLHQDGSKILWIRAP